MRLRLTDGLVATGVLLATVACSLILVGPASAAQDENFGVNVQTLVEWSVFWPPSQQFPAPSPPLDPYLSALSAAGVGVARTDAPWEWVQPTENGPLEWSQLDAVVAALAKNNLRWQPVLDLAPSWAAQTPVTPSGCVEVASRYLPPQDPTQFAAFAGDVAQRYGPGGSFWTANPTLPYLPVARYEVWNEPNVDAYWNNDPSPTQYVALYNAARTAIRVTDPSAQVLVGGIIWGGTVNCAPAVTNDASYIEALFAAGGAGWAVDGIAVHPYGPAVLNVVANLRREQQALQDVGRTEVPLEQTELGWPAAPANAPAGTDAASYPDDASRAGTLALASDVVMGSDCGVQSFDVYTAVEREADLVSDDPPGVSPYDLTEHWMGIYALGATEGEQAPATQSSAALSAAIGRDLAGANAGHDIAVCAPTGIAGRLLALALTVAPTTQAGCFNATVTYQGLPVYGAELSSAAPIQPAGTTSFGPAFTDPNGVVGFCVGAGVDPTIVAVVGGGSFDPDLVPLVAQSNSVAVTGPPAPTVSSTSTSSSAPSSSTSTSTTTSHVTTPVVSHAPACVLSGLGSSGQRLKTVLREGLRVRIDLATIAKPRGCTVSLLLRAGSRTVGTAVDTVKRAGVTSLTIRLTRPGRKALDRDRTATLSLRLDLAGAPVGLGTLTKRVRLSA